jgi:predicted  nucleic acid-binding Zn-ribbon protein
MKTEKAIQVLRDYNLWRKGNDEMEQPDPREIGEAIDDVLMSIGDMEEEAKLHRGAITGWEDRWKCAVELADKIQVERDEVRADLEFRRDLFKLQERQLNDVRNELDEERKEGEEQARLLGAGSEREAKLIAERDLWRAEAQRWREQALDLEDQIETAIKRIQWRQDNLDRGIKELKSDY